MIKFLKQKNTTKGFTHTPKFGVTPKGGGFTLVETLIAISIFSVSVVTLMSFLSQSISSASFAKKKITATYLAQESIESIRNMRDNYILYKIETTLNWTQFKAKLASCNLGSECGFNNSVPSTDSAFIFFCSSHTNGCKLFLDNSNYNTNSIGNDSGFSRKIIMDNINQDEVKISSTVSWMQGLVPRSVTLTENLFNWVE